MHQEITQFIRWLRCKHPHISTHRHYASDLQQFFTWANKAPAEITVSDVDSYIAHAQTQGHTVATINRRLAALSAFYQFLHTHTDEPPTNAVESVAKNQAIAASAPLRYAVYGWLIWM